MITPRKFTSRTIATLLTAFLGFCGVAVMGQTLNISSGTQTYPALTNTTVTMTGRSELQITATANPIPGSIIHLNSADAYFVMLNIKPSTVVSTYLSQFRVSGANAVADSNCRVVQYGNGAVVIPHASSLQPLQVFSGPHFTGTSSLLSRYVYYRGTGLGTMNANISSFKLKRGYMATFAQNENGSGLSKCYIAQDGDLEVSILPSGFDDSVRFVYVLPWRWASKKGIAGNIASGLNVQWFYNWNIDQNSSRDVEYVPIRQSRWWPGLNQNWQTRGANTLLGYNEPDNPVEDAYMTVGDAIWSWPDLLATGLRVGSPATTDGGRSSWLYPFVSQADAAGLRVDFVAVHYYWCFNPADPNGAANQLYNFLKATYDQVKRPLWVTEWNNGANWTGCGDPTFAQQQAAIAAMIEMLDNTPFVERYALYNWVEDVRRVKWDDGSLTSAGVTYRDKVSPVGYVQALQDNGTRSFAQLRFETNTLDSSGYGNNGITSGSPAYTNGHNGQALVFDGANTVVTLPPNVARNNAFTFAAWINWDGGANWQRIFDFGNSTTHYMFLSPNAAGSNLRFAMRNGDGEQTVQTVMPPVGTWQHVAVTLSGNTARIYTNGVLAAQNTGMSITPASFSPRVNTLGRSQFIGDPLFKGLMDDVLITDYALSAAQIAALQTNTPPQFTSSLLPRPGATEGTPYSNTIAGTATDADPGDTLTYSKPTGPAWLSVAADGTLSGTPTSADGGTNYFTVRVTDAAGQNAFALLTIPVTISTASGVWAVNADGNWSETSRWSGNVVASGANQTANFSTLNISSHRTVTLDNSRSIGTLRFSDTGATFFNWTLTNSGGSTLTLETASAASPAIVVTNTATIAAPLAGTNGFTKSGPGTLVLSGNNSLSGTVNIDTSSSSANDGVTRLVGPDALGNATLLQIRNNNSGSSTLQLDGSAGSISVDADVIATCRNNGVITVHNLAGTNIFNGNFFLQVGGNSHTVQADANSLIVFTGPNMYVGSLTGARTYYFNGAGNHLLVGPVLNSTNGAPISLSKSGTGTLTFEAENTYASGTTLAGGTLIVNGSLSAGAFSISGGTTLGGNGTVHPAVTLPSGATLAPGNKNVGKLTVNNNVTLQSGSTTRIELNKTAGTHDQLRVLGTLAYGGTLVVTNLSGTLWAGDAFHIFDASNRSGAFTTTNLPALTGGLVWNFDSATGVLRVAEPGMTGVPPVAPGALAAVGSDAVVNLSWVQSATADVTTNRIYRSVTGIGGPYALLVSLPASFAYADTAVVNGLTYHYVVTAVSPNGESAWSDQASATPQALQSYTADADTLILFHFDEPPGTAAASNHGSLSASPVNKMAYTVNGTSATTTPPLITSVLGASGYPGFGNSANLSVSNGYFIGWDANNSAAYDGDQSGSALSADLINLSVLNMGNGGQSAWTMEAMIRPTNATVFQPRASEIVCMDSSAASRAFQFRLTTTGKLELNFISGTSGGPAQQLADIPISGPHAYAPSTWFHVAAAYDGENVSLYWTKVDPSFTAANLLTNYPLAIGTTFGALTGPLVIGGENRGANTETFPGSIDEVRISSVARDATGFLWQQAAVAPNAPVDLSATAGLAQVALGWSASSGATSYNVKRAATHGSPFTTITNVSTTAFTDTGLADGATYYYVVSALNNAGESVNSLQASATIPVLSPPNLMSLRSGNALTLSWPSDHTGWRLQVQTNVIGQGLGTTWFDVPDSTATNVMTFEIDPDAGSLFYRMTYP